MTLRPHHPAYTLLVPLLPVIDIRRGSKHPLAWQGGDYLAELRAAYRVRPVALADLAVDFERGRVPKAVTDAQVGLFGDMADEGACRVCRL